MRLIGGRDYYDGVQALGHDATTVFVRPKAETMTVEEAKALGLVCHDRPFAMEPAAQSGPQGRLQWRINGGESISCKVGDLTYGFQGICAYVCGKQYTGMEVRISTQESSLPSWQNFPFKDTDKSRFFWEWDEFAAFLASLGVRARWTGYRWQRAGRDRDLSTYFVREDTPKAVLEMLVSRRITIATCRPRPFQPTEWRINGDDLGALGFPKVLEPYAMFQELEMWVTGVLPANANAMVQITDDRIKIAKAGFDVVTSFRKGKAA
jgi:hypothetical protein